MKLEKTSRGFTILKHPKFLYHTKFLCDDEILRLAQESSVIGDYPDSADNPGSSYLWIGQDIHLNREEVAEFVGHLQRWLETGRL